MGFVLDFHITGLTSERHGYLISGVHGSEVRPGLTVTVVPDWRGGMPVLGPAEGRFIVEGVQLRLFEESVDCVIIPRPTTSESEQRTT